MRTPIRDAARAFAVVLGPSVVLDAAAGAALASTVHALRRHHRPSRGAALASGLIGAYLAVGRPLMLHWGATCEDLETQRAQSTRAVTVDAPPEAVWPWLAQIGQDRAGFYSYEWLENLAGCEMRNAERVDPEWQRREVGEPVMLHPAAPGLPVTIFEPGRVIGLEGWGVFVIEPAAGGSRTRLIARGRIPRGSATLFYRGLLEIPHFVMQRKMLLGIKQRAEAAAAQP